LKLAFAARYGAQPLDILLALDGDSLDLFNDGLGELIKGENTPTSAGGR